MSEKSSPLILDLHIPYCIRPENYLHNFHAVGTNAQKDSYLEAMKREVSSYEGELDGYEIQAVRLGGGSATVMNPDLLGELLTLVRRILPVSPHAEVSFDALPNTIGTPSLTGISAGHPTRAELMMRSESDRELKKLNCPFTMQNTRNAMLFFQKFHLNNIGLTVNYGIPGQKLHSWHNTLHACTIMGPGHIRVLPLDETEGEEFPSEAERLEMYQYAWEFLQGQGYRPYSWCGFALPHYEYQYERLALEGVPCVGMGVNGRSVFGGYVTRNTNNCALYIRNAGDFEKLTAEAYVAEGEFLMRQYAMGSLGLVKGLSEERFEERFGEKLPDPIRAELDGLVKKGWADQAEGVTALTAEGMFHYREFG